MSPPRWTAKEVRLLCQGREVKGLSFEDMAPLFPGRTAWALYQKAGKLGLKLPPEAWARSLKAGRERGAKTQHAHRAMVHSVVRVFRDAHCSICARRVEREACWIEDGVPICAPCVNMALARLRERRA